MYARTHTHTHMHAHTHNINSHGLTNAVACLSSLQAPPTLLPWPHPPLGIILPLADVWPPNDKLLRMLPPPLPSEKFPTGHPLSGFVVGTLLHGVLGAEFESDVCVCVLCVCRCNEREIVCYVQMWNWHFTDWPLTSYWCKKGRPPTDGLLTSEVPFIFLEYTGAEKSVLRHTAGGKMSNCNFSYTMYIHVYIQCTFTHMYLCSFLTPMPLCNIYGCLQPREMWFIDYIMYQYPIHGQLVSREECPCTNIHVERLHLYIHVHARVSSYTMLVYVSFLLW